MKFLIFNWRDIKNPFAGGAEKYIHEIGRRLAKNHDITLFTSRYPGSVEKEVIDGVEVIRKGGKFSIYIYAAIEYMKSLKEREYDVIIESINGVPFFTPVYSRKPVVSIIHHIVGWSIFKNELIFPLSVVGYLSERSIPIIYRNCRFIAVSNSTKKEIISFGIKEGNITVIPNGINLNHHDRPLHIKKSDTPEIVYFGRIKNYKRIDHIIKAFKIVKHAVHNANLVIAGKGDYSYLKSLVKKLNLEDSVTLLGEISEEVKLKILSSAWIYVIASEKEGWGITVIEANACGTPAIAYNVPGLRDSIKHGYNGLLVKNRDIKALANSIIMVLTDDKLRKDLSKNAIEWAKRFSWDKSAEKFERIVSSAIRF